MGHPGRIYLTHTIFQLVRRFANIVLKKWVIEKRPHWPTLAQRSKNHETGNTKTAGDDHKPHHRDS